MFPFSKNLPKCMCLSLFLSFIMSLFSLYRNRGKLLTCLERCKASKFLLAHISTWLSHRDKAMKIWVFVSFENGDLWPTRTWQISEMPTLSVKTSFIQYILKVLKGIRDAYSKKEISSFLVKIHIWYKTSIFNMYL